MSRAANRLTGLTAAALLACAVPAQADQRTGVTVQGLAVSPHTSLVRGVVHAQKKCASLKRKLQIYIVGEETPIKAKVTEKRRTFSGFTFEIRMRQRGHRFLYEVVVPGTPGCGEGRSQRFHDDRSNPPLR